MRRVWILPLVACLWLTPVAQTVPHAARPQTPPSATSYQTVVTEYCVTCHNQRAKTAGLMLDTMSLSNVAEGAEVWEKVVRKLRSGAMPPQGARRPDEAAVDGLIAALEKDLDREALARPNPGRPVLHRLNRAEYANAIRDLLALDVNVTSLLPGDDSAYGFDNIADALGISPALLERYLVAAGKVSALAVGDPRVSAGSETYRVRQDLSQDQHIEGLPLGTVGGIATRHEFPVDGEYVFQVKLFRTNGGSTRGLEYPHQIEITLDGERLLLVPVGGIADLKALLANSGAASDAIDARLQVRVPVKAGPRTVAVAFLQKPAVENTRRLQPFLRSSFDTVDATGSPHVESIMVVGPFKATPVGETPSRQRIFVCRPSSAAAEGPCATRIIETLARRAFRRPLSKAELEQLVAFYATSRKTGTFESGIEMTLRRILASPKFVFRAEQDAATLAPASVHRISDLELASRLSFFLWSSIPDDELLTVASQGRLSAPEVLARQVRRMLADTRADALMANFAGQWLQLRNLRTSAPNSEDFPDFDDNLRQAFQRETELFFGSVVREDRNVIDLLTAGYTFVNERLAKHYGIPNVYGSQFRRVALADETRKGLLGKGSMLVTSYSQRTSPVLRGKWILENLLGAPPPPPPPNVPALDDKAADSKPKTMREQMEEHRSNPACASCHKLMDPIGFALENYDAVGAWRTSEAGTLVDASSQLIDGTKVDGVVSLRQALLRKPEVFVGTLAEKLLTYALGRGLGYNDMPAVRAIVRESARHDYRFSSLVTSIASSTPFRMRIKPAPESPSQSIATVAP